MNCVNGCATYRATTGRLLQFVVLLFFSNAVYAEAPVYLEMSKHVQPEQVIQYLKTVPEKQQKKKIAESAYQHAQKQLSMVNKGSSWGAVFKSCLESISVYPMGKTFLLGIEAELKNLVEAPKTFPSMEILQRMVRRFDSAIAVESYERSLDDSRREQLVLYRDCLERYIITKHADANCVPLQWADIVPVK
jgi:hypothetical protein